MIQVRGRIPPGFPTIHHVETIQELDPERIRHHRVPWEIVLTEPITFLEFELPLAIISEANHSQKRPWLNRQRKKNQQMEVMVEMRNHLKQRKVLLPCLVTLTRIGPKKLDLDNLANGCKSVQDSVARELGVDDGDETKVRWVYNQEVTGTAKAVSRYATRIKIESQPS